MCAAGNIDREFDRRRLHRRDIFVLHALTREKAKQALPSLYGCLEFSKIHELWKLPCSTLHLAKTKRRQLILDCKLVSLAGASEVASDMTGRWHVLVSANSCSLHPVPL
ncbi:hypothetical protein AA313_de0200947 [Arthrobotrys entomopaga]|nr:hypothetical protein AA313_de0200947 [Arthrobotrys entomopaga]